MNEKVGEYRKLEKREKRRAGNKRTIRDMLGNIEGRGEERVRDKKR